MKRVGILVLGPLRGRNIVFIIINMLRTLGFAALLGAALAQNTSLPTVDLGYEIYRAADFNVSLFQYSFWKHY